MLNIIEYNLNPIHRDLLTNIKQADQEQDLTDQDIIALALTLYHELENPDEMLH